VFSKTGFRNRREIAAESSMSLRKIIPISPRNRFRAGLVKLDWKRLTSIAFRWNPQWAFVLAALLEAACHSKANCQELDIGGTCQKRVYFHGQTQDEPAVHFDLKLQRHEWFVQYSSWQADYDFADAQYHGSNISLVVFIRQGVAARRREGIYTAPNVALGTIYAGETPNFEDADELGVIWLAYLSGEYFQRQKSNNIKPPFERDPNSAMHFGPGISNKLEGFWALTESKPAFPEKVSYLSDGTAVTAKGETLKRLPPYDKGFTNSYYEVESFTNVDGLRIPLSSVFKVFRVRQGATNNCDLDLLFEYQIKLERASKTVKEMPREQWLDITFCQDYRLQASPDMPFVCYYATNRWPSDEEVSRMKFSEGVFTRDTGVVRRSFVQATVKVALCLFLILPSFFLVFKLLRTKNRSAPNATQ
jgi:hypothetical protein